MLDRTPNRVGSRDPNGEDQDSDPSISTQGLNRHCRAKKYRESTESRSIEYCAVGAGSYTEPTKPRLREVYIQIHGIIFTERVYVPLLLNHYIFPCP